jgi:hypothetical protein
MMRKIIFLIAALFVAFSGISQEENSKFSFPIKNWNVKVIGMENFYPSYLADPLGIRFEASSQSFIYSDYEHHDQVNNGGDYKGRLTIIPGARFSLFKFSPKSNPKLGIELDIGVAIPIVMRRGNNDLIGTDGIYYFALAGRPTEWLSLRFSKHHICTHLGDEFVSGSISTPTDYDPNITQLPVRDDFILSAAVQPLYFLGNPELNILKIYFDYELFHLNYSLHLY